MMTEVEQNGKHRRALVAYASKGGATARIAQWISEGMPEANVDVLDVADVQSLNYDFVVLGAPVRLGRIHPAMVAFLEENRKELSTIPKALFVVCIFTFLGRRYLRKMKQYTEGTIGAYRVFGGRLGILNMLDDEYARAAGKTMWRTGT